MSSDHTHPCIADCGRPADGYYLCRGCADELGAVLRSVAPLAAELETTVARQARIGQPVAVAVSGPPPLPFHAGAAEAADVLRNTLTTWARELSDHMGHAIEATTDAELAGWLRARLATVRAHPAAGELADELAHAIAHAWRAVDRAPGRVYIGPCGADGCPLDLYGRADPDRPGRLDPRQAIVTCECGARWDAAERRSWLFERLHDSLATAREIASAVGAIGTYPLNAKTIRTWHTRGLIPGRGHNPDGVVLHRIGDVVDMAAKSASRRTARHA